MKSKMVIALLVVLAATIILDIPEKVSNWNIFSSTESKIEQIQ